MTGNGSTASEPPPTIESLTADLAHAKQLIDLFRQQRDQATMMCNDLQVQLAITRHELAALTLPSAGAVNPAQGNVNASSTTIDG